MVAKAAAAIVIASAYAVLLLSVSSTACTMLLQVHLLPSHVSPESLGGVVVVIDQLRASSTIVAALAAGASGIVPCLTTNDALEVRQRLGETVLLGGERHGKLIEGFDLGNSPLEYTPEKVRGRVIAFTTTNGTRALLHSASAAQVIIGCLNNQSDVAAAATRLAVQLKCDLHLLCAGTGGVVCMDDVLAAGAIAESVTRRADIRLSDTAMIAVRAFRDASATGLDRAMAEAIGGRNLVEIGMAADVTECTRQDIRPLVPLLSASEPVIRVLRE